MYKLFRSRKFFPNNWIKNILLQLYNSNQVRQLCITHPRARIAMAGELRTILSEAILDILTRKFFSCILTSNTLTSTHMREVYLDHAATTYLDPRVKEAMD